MNSVLNFLQKLKDAFLGLSPSQKIFYAGSILVLLGSLAYLAVSINTIEYHTLYSGISEQDMGHVVERLKAKKIPYRIVDGNRVEVPKDQLYETRLAMATEGVLRGSGSGFEIFDEQKLGSTEFVQKVNYQRALQGELARTINQIDVVAESRVHLVLPEESLFKEDSQPPSAAVVLKLRPGARLGQQQTQGIVNLVASAVPGLQDDKITILSTDGQVIFRKSPSDGAFQMSDQQVEFKRSMEDDLRRKVQTMLEQLLGVNRVITRVSLSLDFNRTQVSQDTYDPDSAVVRSQQRSIENSQGREPGAKGNPDVPVNVESKLLQGGPQGQGQEGQKAYNRQRETVNYEINRISKQVTFTPGSLNRLSVAVIVDGPYETKQDSDGKLKSVFVGRSPEEMKTLEDLVKKAVGYDEGRGDQISLSNVPFVMDVNGTEMTKPENRWIKLLRENQKILFDLLLTALVFVFIIRPFMRKFQQMSETRPGLPEPLTALPSTGKIGEGQDLIGAPQAKRSPLRQQAVSLVQGDPGRAVEVLRTWLREEE